MKEKIGSRRYDPASDSFNSLMFSPDTGESSYFNATCPDLDCSKRWSELVFSSWNASTGQVEGGQNMLIFTAETYRLDEAGTRVVLGWY